LTNSSTESALEYTFTGTGDTSRMTKRPLVMYTTGAALQFA
jgi:hypothetical protein